MIPNRLTLFIVALSLSALPLRAGVNFGDIEITPAAEPREDNVHGYSEYRFLVQNKGDKPRRVTLSLPKQKSSRSDGALTVSRSVEVTAGRMVTLSLAYPARPSPHGNDVGVTIDGIAMSEPLTLRPVTGGGSKLGSSGRRGMAVFPTPKKVAGIGVETFTFHTQALEEGFFRAAAGGLGGGEINYLDSVLVRSTVPVSAWSDNWLGYSRYDGIVVTSKDMNELATSSEYTRRVLRALWRYAETGGVLVVIGGGKPAIPRAWIRDGLSRAPNQQPNDTNWSVYAVGFGQCWYNPNPSSKDWPEVDWTALQLAIQSSSMVWHSSRSPMDLHQSFPVVEEVSVPVVGLFILMILFAIAIGPVNLIVLTQIKRRLWLLWTVPAISAVTCLLLLGYLLIAEGWTSQVRVAGITLLDQIEERATTVGRASFYSPMTPSDGLRFSEDVEVLPMGSDHCTEKNSCTIEWTGEQHLRYGWVAARVPAHYTLRRSETSVKARVSLYRDPQGRLFAVNALGADLQSLNVADEKGSVYSVKNLPAGQEAMLSPEENGMEKTNWMDLIRSIYTSNDWGRVQSVTQNMLLPNTFVGVVDQTPFLERGIKSAKVKTSPSVVLGVFGEIGVK